MWLPAVLRIRYYQLSSQSDYTRARMMRNARKKKDNHNFARQAAIDSARGRALLFALIDGKHPANYTGDL